MNAAPDYSAARIRPLSLNWSIDDGDNLSPLPLRVHFCIRYSSIQDRGRDIGGEVHILGLEYLADLSRDFWAVFHAPFPVHAAIVAQLEAEEFPNV